MEVDAGGSPVFAPPDPATAPLPLPLPLPLPPQPLQAASQPAPPPSSLTPWLAPVKEPSASAVMIEELSHFLSAELAQPILEPKVRIVLLQLILAWHLFGLFDVFERRADTSQPLTVCHSGFKDALLLPTATRAQVDVIPSAAAGSSAGVSGALRLAIQKVVSVSKDAFHSAYKSFVSEFSIETVDGKISPSVIPFGREHLLHPFAPNAHPPSRKVANAGTLLLRTMDEQSLENHNVTYSPLAIRDFANGQSDMHLQVVIACIYGIRIERKRILGNEIPAKHMDEMHRVHAVKQHYITPSLDLAMLVASRLYEDCIAEHPTMPAILAARDAADTALDLFGEETHFEIPEEKVFCMTVIRIVVDGNEEWLACRFTTTSSLGVVFNCFDTSCAKRSDTALFSQQSHDELKIIGADKANARFMQIYMAAMILTDRLCKQGKTSKDQRLTVRVVSQVPACHAHGLSGVFAISLLANFLSLKVNNELSGKQGAEVAWRYHRNVVQHLLPSNWDALWTK